MKQKPEWSGSPKSSADGGAKRKRPQGILGLGVPMHHIKLKASEKPGHGLVGCYLSRPYLYTPQVSIDSK